jgi:hypothetical protein
MLTRAMISPPPAFTLPLIASLLQHYAAAPAVTRHAVDVRF